MDKKRDRLLPCEETFDLVKFNNFPSYVSDDGEIYYTSLTIAIANKIAEKIPEELKPAITVDWTKLDIEALSLSIRNESKVESPFATKEDAFIAEQELIQHLIKEGLFDYKFLVEMEEGPVPDTLLNNSNQGLGFEDITPSPPEVEDTERVLEAVEKTSQFIRERMEYLRHKNRT